MYVLMGTDMLDRLLRIQCTLLCYQQVTKYFPKAAVAVVVLERELRLGDIVCLQRSSPSVDTTTNLSGSRWRSLLVRGSDADVTANN